MAQLNDHILTEWKKNTQRSKSPLPDDKDISCLRLKLEDLKKEATTLKIEKHELVSKCD